MNCCGCKLQYAIEAVRIPEKTHTDRFSVVSES